LCVHQQGFFWSLWHRSEALRAENRSKAA
jgi:hypothetical protein